MRRLTISVATALWRVMHVTSVKPGPGLRVLRFIRHRPRLGVATLVGIASIVFLPHGLVGTSRALLAWDVGAGLYLVLAWIMMFRSDMERIRWRAKVEDDGAAVVLILTLVAATASLAAILLELIDVKALPHDQQTLHWALAALTITISWSFVHTALALHYAHEFYDEDELKRGPCLDFPGTAEPDYVDFLYFSFVIGTTSQTADVAIRSSPMRRLALVHGIIAFFFNATLLAITVNIAAGLI
jgi:uncharacterized membrane protein